MPLGAQKSTHPNLSIHPPSTGSYSQPGSSISVETAESCFTVEDRSHQVNDLPNHDAVDICATEGGVLKQSAEEVEGDIRSPILGDKGTDENSMSESSSKGIHSEATEGGEYVESDLQTLSGNHLDDLCITSNYNSGSSEIEGPSKNSGDGNLSEHEAVAVSASASTGDDKTSSLSASCISTSSDIRVNQKFEALSLNEVANNATQEVIEDSESFLCELHSAGQGDEILNQNYKESVFDAENFRFSPSGWTPAEIEIATGSADCKVMEHPLKLTSAYTEVEVSLL